MFVKTMNVLFQLAFALTSAWCVLKSMSLIQLERPVFWFSQAIVQDWPQSTWYLIAAIGAGLMSKDFKQGEGQ
jgi:hypothetical protein